jgi:probable phosphoglycerate mutase
LGVWANNFLVIPFGMPWIAHLLAVMVKCPMIQNLPDDPAALQFLFMRHGQTQTNAEGRVTGRLDIPLNDMGRAQAASAAQALCHFPKDMIPQVIIHSGMMRARETAAIMDEVLCAHGMTLRITEEEGLKDRHMGEWEGQLWDEAPPGETLTRDALRIQRKFPPDIEPDAALELRIKDAIARCMDPTLHGDGLRLLIWHGGVERMVIRMYGLGKGDKKRPNAKIHALMRAQDGTYHLKETA